MKKIYVVLICIFICLLAFEAVAEELEVEKYSLFNFDYSENTKYKESYYIAYIKNVSDEDILLKHIGIEIFDENGDFIVSDPYCYQCGTYYLAPGDTTYVVCLTYFGEKNYERNAASANLIYERETENTATSKRGVLKASNATIESAFDASDCSMYATIKNKDVPNVIDPFIKLVLEDPDGTPLYASQTELYGYIIEPGDAFRVEGRIGDFHSFQRKLKDCLKTNGITPANVNVFVYYGSEDTEMYD